VWGGSCCYVSGIHDIIWHVMTTCFCFRTGSREHVVGSERLGGATRTLRAASARPWGVLRVGTASWDHPPPTSARTDGPVPAYTLQPPPPRADCTTTLQRGRSCRTEAAPPPAGRATPRLGSISAMEGRRKAEKAPQQAEIGPGNALG
jgi:hypothetical protein